MFILDRVRFGTFSNLLDQKSRVFQIKFKGLGVISC